MRLLIITGTIPVLLLLIGAPLHAFALSDQERWNVGFNDGVNDAMNTWNSGGSYDSSCPTDQHHTDAYCSGYSTGYDHWWNSAQQNSGQQTSQSASVNIRGNGNHVSINQQSNNQVGDNNGGHRHHDGSGQLPNCEFLCLGVNVH